MALCSCAPETVEEGRSPHTCVTVGFAAHSADVSTRGEAIVDLSGLAAEGGFDTWTYSYEGAWEGAADAELLVANSASAQDGVTDHAHVTSPDGSGTNWSYGTQPAFWPEGQLVSSFALAPADAAGVAVSHPSADVIPEVACTLPQPGRDRADLMFAEAVIGLDADASGGRITERFSHALSQINFYAFKESSLAGSEVIVTSVRLIDIYESGTAPLTTPVVWSVAGAPATLEFTPDNGRLAGEAVTATSFAEANALLSPAVGKLFMLPQTLSGDQLEIIYTIDGKEVVKTMPIPLPAGEQTWEPARSYSICVGIQKSSDAIVSPVKTFYESDISFAIPETGYYYIEAWGADGGDGGNATETRSRGGKGSFQSGLYYFDAGRTIQVQVGERGANGTTAIARTDITGGAGGRAIVAGGSTDVWFGAGGSGGEGGNLKGSAGYTGGGGGGGGAASGILSDGNVHLAASGGGGGGGTRGYIYISELSNGGNSNGGGDGVSPGNGTLTSYAKTPPLGGGVTTPAQQNGSGIQGGNTLYTTWPGGGGGGGGGGYNPKNGGGGNGGQGSLGYGSGAGGAGGTNWAGGAYHKVDGSTDVPSDVREAIATIDPLARTSNGNGVVRITMVGR